MLRKESFGPSGASGFSLQSHKHWHSVTNEQGKQLLTPRIQLEHCSRFDQVEWLAQRLSVSWTVTFRSWQQRRRGGYMPHLYSLMCAWPPADSWSLARCSGHRGRWHRSRGHYGKLHCVHETGWIFFTVGRCVTGAWSEEADPRSHSTWKQGVGEEGKEDERHWIDRFILVFYIF